MTFCVKIGTQVHTFSGFGTQYAWDSSTPDVLPLGVSYVTLVVRGSVSMDVAFTGWADFTQTGSLGTVSINPTLTLCDGESVRGWRIAFDRSLYNRVQVQRVTPITGTYTFELWAEGSGDAGFCQYGTRMQTGTIALATVTTTMVDIAVLALGGGAIAVAMLDGLVGLPFAFGAVCSGNPPPMPDFVDDDFIPGTTIRSPGSIGKALQAFEATIWPHFCECIPPSPGDLLPAPPIPPSAPPVDYWGTGGPPLIVCSNEDICTTLNTILRKIDALNRGVSYVFNDQRRILNNTYSNQYNYGSPVTNVTNNGTVAAAAILGVRAVLTSVPSSWGRSSDNPPRYIPAPGSVAFHTADGVTETFWLNDEHNVLVPKAGAILTGYSYHLKPGVQATITPIVPLTN